MVPPQPLRFRIRWPWQVSICIGAFVCYIVIFGFSYKYAGPAIGGLNVLPVFLGGWFFGRKGGLIAFVATFVLTPMLFASYGAPPVLNSAVWYAVPNIITLFTVGMSVGWLRDILDRFQTQSRELMQERAALQRLLAQRERIQADLEQAKDRAEASSRAKSVFLATMSHELRTPLTAILGYAQILQLTAEQDGQHEYKADLEKIQLAGSHLHALINDVLDLSRIEANRLVLHTGPVVVQSVLQSIESMMQSQVAARGNRLVLQYDADDLVFISDTMRVRQVLINIVGNAVKFTEHGEITVSAQKLTAAQAAAVAQRHGRVLDAAEAYSNWLVFSVSDTGIGLLQEHMERIFEPFTQVDESPTRQYGGAGLGLAISRKFCILLGGDLMVASKHGQGSTFTALFPSLPIRQNNGQA